MRTDYEKLDKFAETELIPKAEMEVLKAVFNHLGLYEPYEKLIEYRNRGGWVYGYAKGFTYSYCTSSYADGADTDYSKTLLKFIEGLGFEIVNSYGDNGLDYTTNWRDTFWHYDFAYKPSFQEIECFTIWEDDDYED